jgi:hypothetical protein
MEHGATWASGLNEGRGDSGQRFLVAFLRIGPIAGVAEWKTKIEALVPYFPLANSFNGRYN